MKIEFELENCNKIKILSFREDGSKVEIGHIFTPAGSGEDTLNAIQICGFEEAYDLWGCGVYGEKIGNNVIAKKDIQLLFKDYINVRSNHYNQECVRCYNYPCTCEIGKKEGNDIEEDVKKAIFESSPYLVKKGNMLEIERPKWKKEIDEQEQ